MNVYNCKQRVFYVYSLTDPFDMKIKYIGLTSNLENRIRDHKRSRHWKYNKILGSWISRLNSFGTSPIFNVISKCRDYEHGRRIEKLLIAKLKYDLINVRD